MQKYIMLDLTVEQMEQEFVDFVFKKHPDTKINNYHKNGHSTWNKCAAGMFFKQKFNKPVQDEDPDFWGKSYTKEFKEFELNYLSKFHSYDYLNTAITGPTRYRQLQKFYIKSGKFNIPAIY